MPKMKTKSGAKKRFRLTASGKVRGSAAFHFWHCLNLSDLIRFLADTGQNISAKLLVGHLAASKAKRYLDLVTTT